MDTMQAQSLDSEAIRQAKIELAATCRWASRLGFQSGVCNHFSVAVPGRPDLMLINPEGYFWSEVTAGSLVMATHDGTIVSTNGNTVELTAFCIHAPVHRLLPQATAVLHTHMHHATAICTRKGGTVAPTYLSGMSFFNSIAYDRGFTGAAVTPAEGERQHEQRAAEADRGVGAAARRGVLAGRGLVGGVGRVLGGAGVDHGAVGERHRGEGEQGERGHGVFLRGGFGALKGVGSRASDKP
jgi:ribulose-5-phosphate 4-epimerase/fuculose-1-phosphate aldolase